MGERAVMSPQRNIVWVRSRCQNLDNNPPVEEYNLGDIGTPTLFKIIRPILLIGISDKIFLLSLNDSKKIKDNLKRGRIFSSVGVFFCRTGRKVLPRFGKSDNRFKKHKTIAEFKRPLLREVKKSGLSQVY